MNLTQQSTRSKTSGCTSTWTALSCAFRGAVQYIYVYAMLCFRTFKRVTLASSSYGMKIEAILDRPADNICLDHLARVLVDVHQVREDNGDDADDNQRMH